MSTELYPLTLEPAVADQPWGLSEVFSIDEAVPRGFSGTLLMAAENTKAAAGPLAGRSLGSLKQLWGPKLVGSASGGDPDAPLPVELKLKRTESAALAVSLSEDSLWYVLGAEEESALRAGFLPGLDLEAAASQAGDDLNRWAEFMPETAAEAGMALWLPRSAPLLIGPGLCLAQIGPPARTLAAWPRPEAGEFPQAPQWMENGAAELHCDRRLSVRLVTTSHLSDLVSPEVTTFLWPLSGQARVRARGPAPMTRLQPGRVVMLPAGLGRYAIESNGTVSYLHIEARASNN